MYHKTYDSNEVVSDTPLNFVLFFLFFFFQAEDGVRDLVRSRGLGDVCKRHREHWEIWTPGVLHDVPDFVHLPDTHMHIE